MIELIEVVGLGLLMILPLANPLTTVALFLGLARGMSLEQRRRQIAQASFYVFLIMTVAFYGGHVIMTTFGISIPGLRIAGGLIVVLIGLNMLFSPKEPTGENEAADKAEEMQGKGSVNSVSIAFVPLAMPSTAGPGTIAMLISAAAQAESGTPFAPWVMLVAPVITFALVSVIVWLCLRSSGLIMRWVGESGITAIARLMGFLLVCMGVQFIINGALDIVAKLNPAG